MANWWSLPPSRVAVRGPTCAKRRQMRFIGWLTGWHPFSYRHMTTIQGDCETQGTQNRYWPVVTSPVSGVSGLKFGLRSDESVIDSVWGLD